MTNKSIQISGSIKGFDIMGTAISIISWLMFYIMCHDEDKDSL